MLAGAELTLTLSLTLTPNPNGRLPALCRASLPLLSPSHRLSARRPTSSPFCTPSQTCTQPVQVLRIGGTPEPFPAHWSAGDVVGVAADLSHGELWCAV
jgi:hypothetical protein